jgi:hypothetical protein
MLRWLKHWRDRLPSQGASTVEVQSIFGPMTAFAGDFATTQTYTLARALDVPVLHISAGSFPNHFLVPSWLDMFLEGGAITQDHFAANDFNLGVLQGRGSRDIFVLIRDPRAAARSQVHHLARGRDGGAEPLARRIERQCTENFHTVAASLD